MSGKSASLYFYCLHIFVVISWLLVQHVLRAFHLLKNFEKMWTLGEFLKTYFGILAENFGEMLEILITLKLFCGIVRIFSRNLLETSKKCRKSKFWINSGNIMEKHLGNFKLLILRILRRILKMFLSSFSEIVQKFWRKVANTLYKLLDILKRNFVTFFVNFWKNLWKIIRKTWNYFEKILEYSGENIK